MKHNKKTKSQRKAQEGHLEEGKTVELTNGKKSGKPKKYPNSKLHLKQTPPNTLNASSPPYVKFIIFLLSTTQLARVLPTLCTFSPPLAMNTSNTNREKHERCYA
jgi:hypothetical protein